jgi:hypothetical protein
LLDRGDLDVGIFVGQLLHQRRVERGEGGQGDKPEEEGE